MGIHTTAQDCETWYDGCNCTVDNLLGVRSQLLERIGDLERYIVEMSKAPIRLAKQSLLNSIQREELRRLKWLTKEMEDADIRLRKQVAELEAERDEAVRKRDALQQTLNDEYKVKFQAFDERDEARRELGKLGRENHKLLNLVVKVERQRDKFRELVQCLVDNDPNADAADAVTVYMVWLRDAKQALADTSAESEREGES